MTRVVSFAGTAIAFEHDASTAHVVELLLARLATSSADVSPKATLTLEQAGPRELIVLRDEPSEVTRVADPGEIAEHVQERTAYHFADGCHEGLIVHAGAVAAHGRGLLFPAQSGSGKSTLTAWALARGFSHMSDELVHVSERTGMLAGWMRPIGIKHGSIGIIESLLRHPRNVGSWLDTPVGAIVSPALLSDRPSAPAAVAAATVFPRFERGRGAPELRKLSAAEASTWLLGCTLNARHLPAHGLSAAATFCRRVPGFELVYGSFDGLEAVLRGCLGDHASG